MLASNLCQAQTFSNTNQLPVPNNNSELMIPIVVSGLQNIDSSFGIGALCLDISHQSASDLIITIKSPDGKEALLVDTKGGNSPGFPGTCFQENGSGGWINLAVPPFSGSYFPQQTINLFNDGSNPNGTWWLSIRDVFVPGNTGTFNYVNLTFMHNPPYRAAGSGPCSAANPGGCLCPDSTATDCDLLPDMTASALCIMNDHQEQVGNIRLGNATPNIGYGPLEIHGTNTCYCDTVLVACNIGVCPDGSSPKELINQRVYHRSGNNMTYYDRPAGTMSYHPSHSHVHVDNWADFSLRRSTADPDARNWPRIGNGTKVSFCLVNLGDCDNNLGYCVDSAGQVLRKSDIPNSDFGSVTGCGSSQGIYVGNLDIYSSGLNGMGIILPPNACNGDYFIVSITDPDDNMLEVNEDNNWVAVPITLTLQSGGTFPDAGVNFTVSVNTVNFTAVANNPDSVVWHFGDGSAPQTSVGNTISYTYPGPGFYVVQLYAYNSCGPTVTIDTVAVLPVTTFISEHEALGQVKLFPNPATDGFSLQYSLMMKDDVHISMTDMMGRKVFERVHRSQLPGKHQYEFIKDAAISSGIYFFNIKTASSSYSERLLVH